MTGASRQTEVVRAAPAKINLYLKVTGRRADGYHELDSLVAFTELHDVLTLRPAADLSLTVEGPFAGTLTDQTDNLVLAAARRLRAVLGHELGADITLTKNIPVAAGLGGGSADAAAALYGLCELWDVDAAGVDLVAIGAELGADVPVCLYGRPALVSGIGEQITASPALPAAGVLLVNTRRPLATPEVFRAREGPFSEPPPFDHAADGVAGLAEALVARGNDLVSAACAMCPDVGEVLSALERLPSCRYAGMSGSGATCFGLFDAASIAQDAARRLPEPGWWAAATSLRSKPAG